MSEPASEPGVLYTEYSSVTALAPYLWSLWSFESRPLESDRRHVAVNREGNQEYWLSRSDPLLNVMLPDTSISLMFNLADPGAVGRSLVTTAFLPEACVMGPATRSRLVRPGRTIRAVGAGLDPSVALEVFGTRASELVDRAVPLQCFWGALAVAGLTSSLSRLELGPCALSLAAEVNRRLGGRHVADRPERVLAGVVKRRDGRISVDEMTQRQGVSRQHLARRFRDAAGLSPKMFARITRFQALVRALLENDVSQWAGVSTSVGYYDQAHMINEFRMFAGAAPTVFFQPRDGTSGGSRGRLLGRPSEWRLRQDAQRAGTPSPDRPR